MNSWAWKYFGHVPCFIAQALESVTDMFASVYALGKGSTMSKPVTRTAHCTLMISTWTMAPRRTRQIMSVQVNITCTSFEDRVIL
jgi:hypothetical protein